MNIRYHVELSEAERRELTALVGSGKHYARKLKRAQILLAADSGLVRHDHHEINPLGAGLRDPPPGIRTRAIGIEQQGRHHPRIEWRLTKPAFVACDDLPQIQGLARQSDDELRDPEPPFKIGAMNGREARESGLRLKAWAAPGTDFDSPE